MKLNIQKTILIFFVITIYFFLPFFLQGKLPIASDTLVGLYHPFRDLYAHDYPRGIPFKNFLITDPILQQYPWRNLAINILKNFNQPIWNPYSFSGVPLLANFQSAVFYPFNLLLFFLPFSVGWGVLILLQPLLGGIFLFLYLRKFKINSLACLFGSIVFAFCGVNITWMEWNTLGQVFLWLPIILLAQEHLLKKISIRWSLIFVFALVSQIFAGHLQVWFYSITFSFLYLLARIIQLSWDKKITTIFIKSFKMFVPFFLLGLIAFIIGLVQLLPTFQFISQSARDIDQTNYLQVEGWFLPWQHLVQFFAPDFFGNPTTLNYWGIWNYGELTGYIGIAPLLFAFYAIVKRYDKKTFFFSGTFFVALLFALPTIISQLPFVLHIPFLSTAQPTRLLFLVDFALAVLAALGLDFFIRSQKSIRYILIAGMVIYIGLWVFIVEGGQLFPTMLLNIQVSKSNLIVPTVIFFFSCVVIVLFTKARNIQIKNTFLAILIIITLVDLFRFAYKFLPFTNSQYLYPTTKSIRFLQNNVSNFRIMATDRRMLPPNISVIYKLQSIEGYDPLYLLRYGEFVSAMERGKPDISAPFGFNRIITPHNYNSALINLLGVKYILSFSNIASSRFVKVFSENETHIYQNKDVLPRAFFVSSVQEVESKQQAIEKLFQANFDPIKAAVIEPSKFPINTLQQFSLGSATIAHYGTNTIDIKTNNKGIGFLVLTDVYYPIWHAFEIGENSEKIKEIPIVRTDFLFRGIVVPSGSHTVRFQPSLL